MDEQGIVKSFDNRSGQGVVEIGSSLVLFYLRDGKNQQACERMPMPGDRLRCQWQQSGAVKKWAFFDRKRVKPLWTSHRVVRVKKQCPEQKPGLPEQGEKISDWEMLKRDMGKLPNHTSHLEQALEMLALERIGAAIHFFRKHLKALSLDFSIARSITQYRDIIVRLLAKTGDRENLIDALEILAAVNRDERTKRDVQLYRIVKRKLQSRAFINRSDIFSDLSIHAGVPIDRVAKRVGRKDTWRGKFADGED